VNRLRNLTADERQRLKREVDRRTRQRLKGENARLRAEALLKRWSAEEPPWNRSDAREAPAPNSEHVRFFEGER
jgi:hypothetical protein